MTFALGTLLGLIAMAVRGTWGALIQPWPVWALGIVGLFGYHALYFAALKWAPPAEAATISALWPLLIVLFSAFLPGERIKLIHILGAALGFAGVVVLGWSRMGASGFSAAYLPGYAAALACAFVWSGYSVLSRLFGSVPTDAVTGFCAVTALLSVPSHLLFEQTVIPQGSEWLAIIALGLGPVGAAFYIWDIGVKHGDIRLLGVLSYAAPVLSTCLLIATGFAAADAALLGAVVLIVAGALIASSDRLRFKA
jgi:drug/metabolite transporter (DMT)-like permease